MVKIDRELDRYLTLLRNRIREQGFTQLEVQEALGWGRSYISQLVTKQKNLRIDQVLCILHVIGVRPEDFFGELYGKAPRSTSVPQGSHPELHHELQQLKTLARALIEVLSKKGLITQEGLRAAIERAREKPH